MWISLIYTYPFRFDGLDSKESACSAGDPGLILWLGRAPRDRNGNRFPHPCLENSMDREAWQTSLWGSRESDRTEALTWRHLLPSVVAVWPLSPVWLSATPWAAAHQASLCFTLALSLLKLISIELVMLSNHLILCHPLLLLPSVFPQIRVFPKNWLFASGSQRTGASTLTSVFPVNIQGYFL